MGKPNGTTLEGTRRPPAIMSAVPRKPMRPRSIKVSDDLWEAATKAAAANEEPLSEPMRRFLEKYAKDYYKKGKR